MGCEHWLTLVADEGDSLGGASYVSRILKNNIQMTLVREEDLPRLVYVAVHWHDPRLSVVYCHKAG